MALKRMTRAAAASKSITTTRAARLNRLLQLLGIGPQTRPALTRRLRLDVRGFYRDLELLRTAGIILPLRERRYSIDRVAAAIARLPFPDPLLCLGEARKLAKGRTTAHWRLQELIKRIIGPTRQRSGPAPARP